MNYLSGRIEGDILIVEFHVAAVLDRLAVDSVSTEWVNQLEASGLKKLIIDFSSLEFLSSALLGKLVELRTACLSSGVSLKLCCLTKEFEHVLSLTRLRSQFKTYHSLRSAVERFAADNFLVRHEFFARYTAEPDLVASSVVTGAPQLLEHFPISGRQQPFEF
jgi:anti-sigma B factor antagonist